MFALLSKLNYPEFTIVTNSMLLLYFAVCKIPVLFSLFRSLSPRCEGQLLLSVETGDLQSLLYGLPWV